MLLSLKGTFPPAILALADGTVYVGNSIGAAGSTVGEVVFNTSMTGYQEILTDPSYCQQIVTLTYPHIGNYGVNAQDVESDRVQAAGLIIKDLPLLDSNFRSSQSLDAYLREQGTVAIANLDTRQLTRHLRSQGAQNGCIHALAAGQYINHDMLVATWIGLAIWCFAFSFMAGDRPHAWLARLGFLACALGMLSKGLIGVALPGLVIFVWLIWTRQFRKMLALPWISGLALFAAVALPWFVLAQRSFPNFFNYMFIGQQFNRYTASSYNNPQPWWFYLLALVLLLFPWVFFALAQARRVTADTLAVRLMDSAWWRLCWSWVLAILVFFSIPNSKLVGYILPVLPPLALLAALGWDRIMGLRASAGRWFAGLCVLNIGIALTLMLVVGRVTQSTRAQDVAQVLACAAAPEDTIYVVGGYPYDLPFYIQNRKPLVVLGDWPQWRRTAGDGWERELFEGADFDPLAGQALQPMQVLLQPAGQGQRWLVLRHNRGTPPLPLFWTRQYQGFGWDLYRDGSAPEGPEAAQHKGLPGCRDQRQK